ncbi:tyrosine-type recombinase/integrase [Burkholderia cenocepacia]|uniref:Site-specific integrase n=1 Tax=Burkholderia cenocepacia TaxID=95486 RepID=A0A3Q9F8B2_9BURK|nr:site-specific integrase [Burkholderia cenocepacia]AZQ51736.1 site-specific integrase [Burkholderia cenocepacia]
MSVEGKRKLHRLSALSIERLKVPGYYADGGGLYLQVSPSLSKSWIFRFKRQGRTREMGLGPLHTVGLADARKEAAKCRVILLDGADPLETRRQAQADAQAQKALKEASLLTFDQCAEKYLAAHEEEWANPKHRAQWKSTLKTYASPHFGFLPVADVTTELVQRALETIWKTKNETASRLRGRIEAVLDWAKVRGYRSGDNPARWRGHLDHLLPRPSKVQKVVHHPALPYLEMGNFIAELRDQGGVSARALEFLILTTSRTGEVIGARPEEFDLHENVWTVPAERMKGKREHRVPLVPRAAELAKQMMDAFGGEYVFPGAKADKPLSNMAMLELLRRMGRGELTVHGFRSTFRDWAAERTNFPREIAEAALAHISADKVELAYLRSDFFQKRRQLMTAWAKYCNEPRKSAEVVAIRGEVAAG